MAINYQQKSDGTHLISMEDNDVFDAEAVLPILKDIHHQAYSKPAYIVMNFTGTYHLPVREFVMQLKQFYTGTNNSQNLRIALVVQPSFVRVLEAVVKTLVTREFIQYFTAEDRALVWLSIERGKNAA